MAQNPNPRPARKAKDRPQGHEFVEPEKNRDTPCWHVIEDFGNGDVLRCNLPRREHERRRRPVRQVPDPKDGP
jgi:hypothetical protein